MTDNIYTDRRKALIEALRSGEYDQCRSRLKSLANDKPQYCCLGVACVVAGAGNRGLVFFDPSNPDLDKDAFILPSFVRDYFGFSTQTGLYYLNDDNRSDLTALNDSGKSFEFIADVIESNPKGLWKENST